MNGKRTGLEVQELRAEICERECGGGIDERKSTLLIFLIELPVEQVYKLDRQLARRLIDELPDFSSSHYWIGLDNFIPLRLKIRLQ